MKAYIKLEKITKFVDIEVQKQKMLKRNGPLCIFLPKLSACRRDFDETKYISFLIKDDELLEKYNEI